MADVPSKYLIKKEIELDQLATVCRSRVFCKQASISIYNDAGEIVDEYNGYILFRELVDALGRSQGFERLLDEKVKRYPDRKAGDKYLTYGSSTYGFTPIGFDPQDLGSMEGPLIINAGIADGYRLYQATGIPVACGVGELQIPKIAAQLTTAISFYNAKVNIITTADNDPAGLRACIKSSKDWCIPDTHKDWSDVYQNEGIAAVKKQFFEGLQTFIPIDKVEETLEQMGLKQTGNNNKDSNMNIRFFIKPDNDSVIGYRAGLMVPKSFQVNSLKQYKELFESVSAFKEVDGGYGFSAKSKNSLVLLMSLLESGVAEHLDEKDKLRAAMFKEKMIEQANKGYFNDAEAVAGNLLVIKTTRNDSEGLLLQVSLAYDTDDKKILRSQGAIWNKTNKTWDFLIKRKSDLINKIEDIDQAFQARAVLTHPALGGFKACHKGNESIILAALDEDLTWLSELNQSTQRPSAVSERVGVITLDKTGKWPMLAIRVERGKSEIEDRIKELGGSWKNGMLQLPVRKHYLDTLVGLQVHISQQTSDSINDVMQRCGFGVAAKIGRGELLVKFPYDKDLSARLGKELPKIARTFDPELEGWIVKLGSCVVSDVLKEIMSEFDIRLMLEGGRLGAPGEGFDTLVPQALHAQAASALESHKDNKEEVALSSNNPHEKSVQFKTTSSFADSVPGAM